MSQTCIIASKSEKLKFDNSKDKVLYIEDYVEISSVAEARKLTDRIFSHNADFIAGSDYKGYKVTWSWYSDVFQFCIKYLEIERLAQAIDALDVQHLKIGNISPQYRKVLEVCYFNKNVTSSTLVEGRFSSSIKQVLFNTATLLFSMVSMLYFILRPGRNVATYTGDFVYKNTKSDFRLNHLYEKYKENNIQFIEFIRDTTIKNFFINTFKRKRFAIHYMSIIFFVDLFMKRAQYSKQPHDFYQSILYDYYHANIVLTKSTLIIERILKVLRVDKFVLISFSSRSAPLAIAAKSLGIKTIGIMHGLQQKDYAVYEFMQSYQESKKIGCDIYGVWSEHYLEYFRKYSKISTKNSFQLSGLLRPAKSINQSNTFERVSRDKIKVLLISEPLVSVLEIIPYIKCLVESDDIEVAIKIRPMIEDVYYESMKLEFPEAKDLKVYDGKIEDIVDSFDIFIGSNSTAIIEASLFGKISILLNTIKFGDYFDMDGLIPSRQLLIRDPDLLCKEIQFRIENESNLKTIDKTKYRFFGDNKDGAQWVVDQL
ncbi:hypothetical protein [Candidatus Thioglobus autotrophicus]|uniref:hypothetical protein n=1 Tax=Candidatus Thioglobus autotrophicus TaxID=1705394 RepID=UPI00299E4C90|nr:hypothetical protein [Candidatus Thioglobus autotrophicus]WPE17705.1 hypothetical protein R5P05_06455 [Candidatus Thioglobus autotrophicus]